MQTKKNYKQLNGLKGIACIGVFVGHFSGIWKYAGDGYMQNLILKDLTSIWLPVLFDESIWLMLFCLISGFVTSLKEIETFSELIKAIVKRFVRFYFLILGACIIIYGIEKCIGFHNVDTRIFLINAWLQKDYNSALKLGDILFEPCRIVLRGRSSFNSSYWMINRIFFSSIIVYICIYLSNRSDGIKNILWILGLGCCVGTMGNIGLCFICGCFLNLFHDKIKCYLEKRRILQGNKEGIILFLWANGHAALSSFLSKGAGLPKIIMYSKWKVVYITVFLIMVLMNPKMKKFFSNNIFLQLYKISFGIYSFHWPVICSVGSISLLYLFDKIDISLALIFTFNYVIVVVLALSIVYHWVVEKGTKNLLVKMCL